MFHCTDIKNVVSILSNGEIYSRSRITSAGQLPVDIASPQVMKAQTSNGKTTCVCTFGQELPLSIETRDFVQLVQQELNAHCPVPVYLIFDALAVLSRADSCFSDGNMGSPQANVHTDVSSLEQIPFNMVYHDTWFDPSERDRIVHHRNAEVLAPERMGLENLRYIGCLSDAEYKTLLHLLPSGTHSRWADKIGVRPSLQLFNRQWTFAEQAELSTERIVFHFNRTSLTPGPFDTKIEIHETVTGMKYLWHNLQFQCDRAFSLALSNLRNSFDYTASLTLDGHLAYADRYQDDDLPF